MSAPKQEISHDDCCCCCCCCCGHREMGKRRGILRKGLKIMRLSKTWPNGIQPVGLWEGEKMNKHAAHVSFSRFKLMSASQNQVYPAWGHLEIWRGKTFYLRFFPFPFTFTLGNADRIHSQSKKKLPYIFQLMFPNAKLQSGVRSITLAHPEPKGATKMNKLLKNRSKCCQTLLKKHIFGKKT